MQNLTLKFSEVTRNLGLVEAVILWQDLLTTDDLPRKMDDETLFKIFAHKKAKEFLKEALIRTYKKDADYSYWKKQFDDAKGNWNSPEIIVNFEMMLKTGTSEQLLELCSFRPSNMPADFPIKLKEAILNKNDLDFNKWLDVLYQVNTWSISEFLKKWVSEIAKTKLQMLHTAKK